MEKSNKNKNINESLTSNLIKQIKDNGAAEGMNITEKDMAQAIGISTEAFDSLLNGEGEKRYRQNLGMKLAAAYDIKKTSIKITHEIKIVRKISVDDNE